MPSNRRPRCPGVHVVRLVRLVPLLLALGESRVRADDIPASTSATEVLPLSLSEVLRRGELYAPVLVRAKNEQKITQGRMPSAKMILPQNPLATVLVGHRSERQTEGPPNTGVQFQLHVEQAIEVAGQRFARIRAVEAAIAAAQANTEFAKVETRAILFTLYVQGVFAEERASVAKSRKDTAEQLYASALSRQKLGASSDIEVNLAQIEVGRVAGDLADAQVEREARLTELRALVGVNQDVQIALTTRVKMPPALSEPYKDIGKLTEVALKNRGDLRSIVSGQRELSEERSRLAREAAPNPIVAFDYQRDLPGQDFIGGTLGLTLPIWNRNQGPLAQMRAAQASKRNEEQLLRLRISAQVAQALRTLNLRRDQATQYQTAVLPPAERNVDLLRRGWQAGKFDLFRVITASRELADTRLRYLDILERLWLASIEVERAVAAPIVNGGEGKQ